MVTLADLVSTERADFPQVVNPSLPYLDFLLLNEYELSRLAGARNAVKDPDRVEAQARQVMRRGVNRAVLIHFPEGALCVPREAPALWQPSVRLPAGLIAGTAGAGDAFAAGWIYGLHEGWSLSRCLELAVCVAAASLRHATCSHAVAPWEDCLRFGREWGFG
jgi:sugar/nucleoside kinase (ribokinase family)